MDYSVVVAVDKNSGEITAGIIDYIRTFTWDKKVLPPFNLLFWYPVSN